MLDFSAAFFVGILTFLAGFMLTIAILGGVWDMFAVTLVVGFFVCVFEVVLIRDAIDRSGGPIDDA